MKANYRVEWTAFAVGLAIALVMWLWIHNRNLANLTDFHVLISEAQDQRSDKPYAEDLTASAQGQQSDGGSALSGETSGREGNGNANSRTDTRPGSGNSGTAGTRPGSGNSGTAGIRPGSGNNATAKPAPDPDLAVRVYLTKERRVERVPLETYVRGVVAGEMPPDFEPAALEAQALAARTYIVRRLMLRDESGMPPEAAGADVTDTQSHQVYLSRQAMDRLRQRNEAAWRKADEAAARTEGRIIAYRGEPIQALYFSASNGFTENSEDVFPGRIPYLRSVASPWDRTGAPRNEETIELPLSQFYAKLGIRTLPVFSSLAGYPKIRVTAWTPGKRIKTLTVGGKSFTGPEVRSKLGLRSASFAWSVKGGKIAVTAFGSGHGVGMSQWGAEGMAKAGRTAEQIVEYYYKGTGLMEVSNLADKL